MTTGPLYRWDVESTWVDSWEEGFSQEEKSKPTPSISRNERKRNLENIKILVENFYKCEITF
jgi:hypothetical protein